MSDTKSGDEKTLTVNPKKTLTLKRPGIEQSTVRQNFSHGRTKSVVVETKRKFVKPGEKAEASPALSVFKPKAQTAAAAAPAVQEAPQAPAAPERSGIVLNELSSGEMEARRRALEVQGARGRGAPAAAEEPAPYRRGEARRREREESARRRPRRKRGSRPRPSPAPCRGEARRRAPLTADAATDDEEPAAGPESRRGHPDSAMRRPRRKPAKTKGEEDRRRGKLTL